MKSDLVIYINKSEALQLLTELDNLVELVYGTDESNIVLMKVEIPTVIELLEQLVIFLPRVSTDDSKSD